MKFCTMTLGCKVNQSETQSIESIMISRGHSLHKPGDGCDLCVINTCAVTAESARKSRQAVRRIRKMEPDARVAVCGCLSQLEPVSTAQLGADLVGGSGDRQDFVLEIERMYGVNGPPILSIDDPAKRRCFEELPNGVSTMRTRALLKIQDGCDNCCTYCVVPHARGRARSLPPKLAADHALWFAKQGYLEIVITGIEISSYGKDLPGKPMLTDIVRDIAAAVPHVRLRLGSLDPGAVTESFCAELQKVRNLCGHFHISLQSGCDETLRRMGRKYDTLMVQSAITRLRQRFPDCGITADPIAGFPGETENEFEQTLKFIENAAFSRMHIFPFSARAGTLAAVMPDQIDMDIRRDRARKAAAVAEDMAKSFYLGQIGKTVDVLFERKRGGFWAGYSGNYIEITAESGGAKNSINDVQITNVIKGITWGKIIRESGGPKTGRVCSTV